MNDDREDRKPTLRFNYEGFSTGEQNKVEDTNSSVKQRKHYNCILMAKKPDKYIRLPVHLACKTCPRGQVDCYIEISADCPRGNLSKKCETCLSGHCTFKKMDDGARAELRSWLDKELGRRRDNLARANAVFGRDVVTDLIDVTTAVGTSAAVGGNKRSRPTHVESDEEGDTTMVESQTTPKRVTRSSAVLPTPLASTRPSASIPLPLSSSTTARGSAIESAFVQEAIKLVTNAQTIDRQLADLRSSLDTAKAAQVETEKSLQRATAERGEATAKVVELQKKLDDNGRSADERQTALDRAIRRTSLSEDASARYRKERNTLRDALAEARSAESTALGKVIGLQSKLNNIDQTAAASRATLKEEKTLRAFAEGTADRCKRELEGVKEKLRSAEAKMQDVEKLRAELDKERAEHETKSKELDRWKKSIAALQGA